MAQFISVSLRQIMQQGTSIVKECSRINDARLYPTYLHFIRNARLKSIRSIE